MSFEYGKDGARLLLVGLDGSVTSWRATSYAAGLARRQHASLVVVHVLTGSALAALTPQGMALELSAEEQWSTELDAQVRDRLAGEDLTVIFERRRGEAAQELAAAADEHLADAVVVGASGQRGHRLLGSTAVKLVRAGRWPVTVVP